MAVRRLRRKVRRQEKVLLLQVELLRLLDLLESPVQMVPPELLPATPPTQPLPETLDPPDQLTPEEIEELRAMPMPDPLEEIQQRLASTTP
jgi:hypothetical protein